MTFQNLLVGTFSLEAIRSIKKQTDSSAIHVHCLIVLKYVKYSEYCLVYFIQFICAYACAYAIMLRGGTRNFLMVQLTLPTRGLKYG